MNMEADLSGVKEIRRRHPIFFWGTTTVALLLLTATVVVAARIPQYRSQSQAYDEAMTEAERTARDRILNSEAKRSELAIALIQRELRLKELADESVHLALSTADSTLSLRHGTATLREVRLTVGPDSTVVGPAGKTWRLVQALGERRLEAKESSPTLTVPEWVYVSRGEPLPPESERRIEGGLGDYVLRLDDGTEIHTRPTTGPFTTGARPGAFIVESEEDMRAMYDALELDTPVYIY
jgi:hypothetical protein